MSPEHAADMLRRIVDLLAMARLQAFLRRRQQNQPPSTPAMAPVLRPETWDRYVRRGE
jgi:hypothetical protein